MGVRRRVFIEEQGVETQLEQDGLDTESTHWLVLSSRSAIATGRLRVTTMGPKLERVAVLRAHRGQGMGALLVEAMLLDVSPGDVPFLNAQLTALGFWKKLGFDAIGKEFSEAGIMHQTMVQGLKG